RFIPVRFGERGGVGFERAINFVRRHVQKTKFLPPSLGHLFPIGPSCFKQSKSATNVGFHKGARSANRSIDVAFCGHMHYCPRPVRLEKLIYKRTVANIALYENMPSFTPNSG